jgi:RES domain
VAAAEPSLVLPPPGGLVRIGAVPWPFHWPEPRVLAQHGPAPDLSGSRFDAPRGEYRTLYFASDVTGALVEVLARFRQVPDLAQRLSDDGFDTPPDPEHDPPIAFGAVVADYLTNRCAGSVHVDDQARFIDVDDPATHNFLHLLAGQPLLDRFGLDRIDRGSFLSRDRALTRHLALELYTHAHDRAAGLRYPSALDPTVTCYAVWDHADELLSGHDVDPLDVTQQTVRDAAARLRLTL